MERIKNRLAAMIPYYDRQGANATLIYTTDGEIIADRRTVKWNLRRLARLFGADLQAVRQNYGSYLGCRQGIPLPLSAGLVLISLKTRLPVGKNDGCYGYINVTAVDDICPDSDCRDRCVIRLAGEQNLTCFYSCRTVRSKMRLAKIARDYYRQDREVPDFASQLPLLLSPSWGKLIENLIRAISRETDGPDPSRD